MMKMKIFYNILLSITALALLTLTSCLDDSLVDTEVTRFDEAPDVVDFNEKPNSDGFIRRAFDMTSDPDYAQATTFTVNLSSQYTLDHDLNVTVEFDETATIDFADEMGWIALDPARQDITSTTVTIAAGEREADFTVNFKVDGFAIQDNVAAAYTITAVDDPDVVISGNFGTQYVRIGVANVFEGDYVLSENFWSYYGTDYSGLMANPVHLTTVAINESVLDYFYAGWGDVFYFTIDLDNPATIDGHANAYPVTVSTPGWSAASQQQIDDYDGGVWNYCYEDGDKWIFKICHEAGGAFGYATYTQQ